MKKALLLLIILAASFTAVAQNYYTVNVAQPPQLVTNAGPNVTTCYYDSVQIGSLNLASGGEPPYVYAWFPTYGLSDHTIPNPMALPDDTTTYTISVTDANNCTSWSQVTINIDPCAGVKEPSNAFSCSIYPNPNNTGVFNISLEGKKLFTDYTLSVYSIYGQLLLTTNIQSGDRIWNGSLDLSPYAGSGIYILEVKSTSFTRFQKVIIQ